MDGLIKNEQLRNNLMKKKMEFDAAVKSGDTEKAERLRGEIVTQLTSLNFSMKGMEPMAMSNNNQKEQEEDRLLNKIFANMGISEKETSSKEAKGQDPTDQLLDKVFSNLGIEGK